MRHRIKKTAKLGRKSDHRQLLLRNLATSIILSGKIKTTETKASTLQPFVDNLIANTKSKANDREAIRYLKSVLLDEKAQKIVLQDLKKKYADRSSGFTRITPLGVRAGDGAKKVLIELIS